MFASVARAGGRLLRQRHGTRVVDADIGKRWKRPQAIAGPNAPRCTARQAARPPRRQAASSMACRSFGAASDCGAPAIALLPETPVGLPETILHESGMQVRCSLIWGLAVRI